MHALPQILHTPRIQTLPYTPAEEMSQKDVKYVPGFYKIFDEIIVNAVDNFARDPEHMTYIKVDIDAEAGHDGAVVGRILCSFAWGI